MSERKDWWEADPRPPIEWSRGATPFAYVAGRAIARGDRAADRVNEIVREIGIDVEIKSRDLGGREETREAQWILLENVANSLDVVQLARADGFEVQPDHVFFAHGCDECCGPHPSMTFDAILADPYRANPYRANPYRANPYRANPYRANPYRANPYRANPQTSSAIPAAKRAFPDRALAGPGDQPSITVLDTGLAHGAQLPALLGGPQGTARITGDIDEPDSDLVDTSSTSFAKDTWLDPVAGHGTFIAGLIEQLAPGCKIHVEHVISGLGDAIESAVFEHIDAIAALGQGNVPDILSLSFGGTGLAQAPALRRAIRRAQHAGIVVVASAGNDGTCEPQYPAAYDGVIAVGAVGPDGPCPWSNYGSWVDACAPGADLVSAFFADFDGPEPRVNTFDPDRFGGWAIWSGTSFAGPVVVAALAREMVVGDCSAKEAVDRIVHAPEALRIRCLGTVVNA